MEDTSLRTVFIFAARFARFDYVLDRTAHCFPFAYLLCVCVYVSLPVYLSFALPSSLIYSFIFLYIHLLHCFVCLFRASVMPCIPRILICPFYIYLNVYGFELNVMNFQEISKDDSNRRTILYGIWKS